MDAKYTIFNPKTSKVASEISNKSTSELIRRYIKKKTSKQTSFYMTLKEEVNKIDEEEYLINPYLFQMEGSNLDHVARQLFIVASKLKHLGYELNLDIVARDLDRLFGEYSNEVDKMTKESSLEPISKEISSFFVTEIITNKIIDTLENTTSKNSNID